MNFADENGYIEIVIYVVLMILGLAVSAYRNFVKKKEQQQKIPGEVNPDFPESAFDSVYDSAEDSEEENYNDTSIPVELLEPEEPEKEPELLLAEQKHVKEKISSEGQPVFESTKHEIQVDDYLETQRKDLSDSFEYDYNRDPDENRDSDEKEVSEGFDLKKAVIYSEIMNPKYF